MGLMFRDIVNQSRTKIDVSECLSVRFKALAERFYADMTWLSNLPSEEIPEFLCSIPEWRPDVWKGVGQENNNCYNFSLNRFTSDFRKPGRDPIPNNLDFPEFADKVIRGAAKDGLRPLRYSFLECQGNEFPVALFLQKYQQFSYFHWLALRQMPSSGDCSAEAKQKPSWVWAHKKGEMESELVGDLNYGGRSYKSCDVFRTAQEDNYNYFVGFYAVSPENTF